MNRPNIRLFILSLAIGLTAGARDDEDYRRKQGYFDGVQGEGGEAVMAAAEQRIETVRKGDFSLQLKDAQGNPVEGELELKHIKHDFNIGVNLQEWHRVNAEEKCWAAADDLFNLGRDGSFWGVMIGSSGKVNQPDEAFTYDPVDAKQHHPYWARARGMDLRWHCLLYPHGSPDTGGRMPPWHASIESEEEWWELIDKYFRTLAARNQGWFKEYDVINEMFTCQGYYEEHNSKHPRLYEAKAAARTFEIARKYFPDAKLTILEGWHVGSQIVEHNGIQLADKVFELYQDVVDLGAPVDIIGTQCHFGVLNLDAITMRDLEKGFDRLGSLGRFVAVTEYNPPSPKPGVKGVRPVIWGNRLTEQESADWSANFHKLMFSKPYMNGITRWQLLDEWLVGGGTEGVDGGVLSVNGRKKQEFFALKKLFQEEYTTQLTRKIKGEVNFRGFYGTYEVNVPGYESATVAFNRDGSAQAEILLQKQRPYRHTVDLLHKLECEEFDQGGEGVSWHSANQRIDSERGTTIQASAGEWFEYTVDIAAGVYDIGVRAASQDSATVRVSLNGRVMGDIEIPASENPQTVWFTGTPTFNAKGKSLGKQRLNTPALDGKILRVEVLRGSAELDSIRFEAPDIVIKGNGMIIFESDNFPSVEDGTDFSRGPGVREFVITNQGNSALRLSGQKERVEIVGEEGVYAPQDFKVVEMPNDVILPGKETTFKIAFTPTAPGLRKAFVRIRSNDGDESPAFFSVQGNNGK